MQKQLENPPFTPLFRIVTGAEIVVVGLAGIGLFFLPILAKPQWPWIMTGSLPSERMAAGPKALATGDATEV